MKKQSFVFIAVACAALVLLAASTATMLFAAQEKASYTCPMHPDVVADKPGKCPKCGMDLVAKNQEPAVTAKYTCPMDPDVISDKPGKCPKCGMNLVPVKPDKK
jgi:membrane fusion protein, copper/silver efflux system